MRPFMAAVVALACVVTGQLRAPSDPLAGMLAAARAFDRLSGDVACTYGSRTRGREPDAPVDAHCLRVWTRGKEGEWRLTVDLLMPL